MTDDALSLPRKLQELEKEAREPLVPGDLAPWCRRILEHLDSVDRLWQAFRRDQQEVNEQILSADPELARRAELLEKSRQDLGARRQLLEREARKLLGNPGDGSREPAGEAKAWRRRLLAWVGECRKLVAEQRTWLVESHYRDRGPVD